MAFPTTSVLSSFTGADEDPLSEGGNWAAGVVDAGVTRARRVSNQVAANNTTAPSDSYWAASFASNQEAYVTMATLPTAGNGIGVHCRVANPGNASTATSIIGVYHPGTGFRIFEFTAGVTFTQIGTTNATAASAGDKIGLECNGSNVTLYHFTGGTWNSRVATTTSITGSGFVGWLCDDNTGRGDDFGGGAIVTASTSHLLALTGVGR